MYAISLIHAQQLNCTSGKVQLFYDDAESMTGNWTFDDDDASPFAYTGPDDHYCYSGDCTYISDFDYDATTDPSLIMNSPVNTAGYIDIEVIYHANNADPEFINGCQSFYSADNGMSWNLIDSSLEGSSDGSVQVRETLSDIDSGATIILKLTTDSNDLRPGSVCLFDEIRICGTASSDNESDDDSDDDDSDSDDSNDTAAAKAFLNDNIHNIGVKAKVISVDFSNETIICMWILFSFSMLYVIFCFVCYQRRKGGAKIVYGSSTMGNVDI